MIYLIHTYFDINILQYVTFRAAGAAITALLISFLWGPKIIRTLQNHQIGETIRKNGPLTHYLKEGTPTMGGIIIILSIILPTILWSKYDNMHVFSLLPTQFVKRKYFFTIISVLRTNETTAHKKALAI